MLLRRYNSKPLFCHHAKGSVPCFGTAGFNPFFEKKEFNMAALSLAAALSRDLSSWTQTTSLAAIVLSNRLPSSSSQHFYIISYFELLQWFINNAIMRVAYTYGIGRLYLSF